MTAKSRSIAAKRPSHLAVAARMTAATLATAGVLALLAHGDARAADAPAADTSDQVIVPQVERREVHKPKYPSNDFEIGLFGGSYTAQNFGTHFDWGARIGYDITEDFFVEATYGRTKVSDKEFRQILPGGLFTAEQEKLKYYDLSLGWNFLPGEVFIGKNWAKASTMYAIGGLGTTSFDSQRMQTWNFGVGAKLFLADWVALRADVRDHIYTLDLLGKRGSTQNPELTLGFAFFF
ncbi:MAG TPA: outer membrane beta-barrel domain-containing protein [Burkholderiaceae bacterium]|jgi:outer membrane beta-barrel protein|nr:outer membrane beta-barrel domain-containing protein [Burkholderiaceae bacterium]